MHQEKHVPHMIVLDGPGVSLSRLFDSQKCVKMYLRLKSLLLVYQADSVSTLRIMGSQNYSKLVETGDPKEPCEKQSQTPL